MESIDSSGKSEAEEIVAPSESARPEKPFTALSEIRQLVEGFYDIQHLRLETYNRIVAYVKQNSERIIVLLRGGSQVEFVNQINHASQRALENHSIDASQPSKVLHRNVASQTKPENQIICAIKLLEDKGFSKFADLLVGVAKSDASSGKPRRGRPAKSHFTFVNQINIASHQRGVTPTPDASHYEHENQRDVASHSTDANHTTIASQNINEPLENTASQSCSVNHIPSASHKIAEDHVKPASHPTFETQTYQASQTVNATYIINIAGTFDSSFAGLVRPIVAEIDNLLWFYLHMLETEVSLGKRLDRWSRTHPLRVSFLSRVYGIGGTFSSGIIAWLGDPILKSEYVSSIWRYCGLTPDSKRIAGKKTDYDVKLKTFCWKISTSFIKFDCFGRQLYLQYKEDVKRKHPEPVQALDAQGVPVVYRKSGEPKMLWTPKHIDMYARRKVVKMFLSAVWETWRKMNGRPVGNFYPMEHLGHKHYISPDKWIEKPLKVDA
jgi:hypothetical protein